MKLKSHLQAIGNLQGNIQHIKDIAEKMPESTTKGRILQCAENLETTANDYADGTVDLYEQILNFAMRCAV